MKVLGYGEDFLTFWAVTKKLPDILKQLCDKTSPENCVVIYRPSFGRKGGKESSQFGELDSMIITPETAYLIEAKWDGSEARWKNNVLELDHVQVQRHKIFKWYHENWEGEDWKDFIKKHKEEFEREFGKKMAPAGSLLSRNLLTIMKGTHGKKLVNVLLFLHHKHETELPEIKTTFKKVLIKFKYADGEYAEI
jgi:hypothetical protein